MKEVKHYKVKSLPSYAVPDAIFYVKSDTDTKITTYITDLNGVPYLLKDDGVLETISNSNGTISVTGTTDIEIKLDPALLISINSALQSGDNISSLNNDIGYVTNSDISLGINKVAGENISSGMAVIVWTDNLVYKYNIANLAHAGLTCGISKTSGLVGETILVVTPENKLTEVGSGWNVGKSYFIGSNSLLTVIPPTSGISKKIATGVDVDTIIINNYPEHILL